MPRDDRRLGDALHREPVGSDAHRELAALGRVPGLVERAAHDVVELRVHLDLLPEVLLEALHPLEVRDDDAARVREHVGEDQHALVLEDRVGRRRDRAVRALADDRGLDLVGVLRGDHLLERARREDVAVEQQELLVGDRLGVLEADERAVLGLVGERGRDVDALRVVERRRRVGDRDDERALLMEEVREVAADVAEALDDDLHPGDALVELRDGVADAEERAARRSPRRGRASRRS